MPTTLTTKQIVECLVESEWWPRAVAICEKHDDPLTAVTVEAHLQPSMRYKDEQEFTSWWRPLRAEMLDLVVGIESGTVYGSMGRCAICDGGSDTHMTGSEHCIYTCYSCHANFHHNDLWSAGAVLRARRLRKAQLDSGKTCANCGHTGCNNYGDQHPAVEACWTEAGDHKIPTAPICFSADVSCGVCQGPTVFWKDRDVYRCRYCQAEVSGVDVRASSWSGDVVVWTKYPHHAVSRLPDSFPEKVDPYARHIRTMETSSEFLRWMEHQTGWATGVYENAKVDVAYSNAEKARLAKRHDVLFGLAKADEGPMVRELCELGMFDPRLWR
jgi:DNA-directed RNA polymerase subunit RPC12/RpoP